MEESKRKLASQINHPRDGKTYGLQGEIFVEIPEGGISQTSGEWTPTIVALGSNPTLTYVAQNGYWIKTGSLIHFRVRLQWSAVSGGSGGLRVPLPPTLPGLDNVPGAGASINRVTGLSFTGQMVFSIGTTHININSMQEDGTFSTVDVSDMGTSGTIYISGFYEEDPS